MLLSPFCHPNTLVKITSKEKTGIIEHHEDSIEWNGMQIEYHKK